VNPSPTDDIYVDEPWLLLRWDRDHQCVFAEWKAFATSMEFQSAWAPLAIKAGIKKIAVVMAPHGLSKMGS
jgi:hypothetical protein